MRTLCTAVVPVAGLIAETGLTLREDEAWALRQLAQTPATVLTRMLRSVDTFCEPEASELTVELRRSLLDRLGVFGVRSCLDHLEQNEAATAKDLSRLLVEESGLDSLRSLITGLFLPRAHVLKARAALAGLRSIAQQLDASDPISARRLAAEVERCEASSPDFAELRLSHLVTSGLVDFNVSQRAEFAVVISTGGDVTTRLGLAPGSSDEVLRGTALAGVDRWRTLASAPMADVAMREACETMAHTYEGLFVALHEPRPGDT